MDNKIIVLILIILGFLTQCTLIGLKIVSIINWSWIIVLIPIIALMSIFTYIGIRLIILFMNL